MDKCKNNNNYLETKNYIHNELNITKEYIQEVIKETVREEIKKSLKDDGFLKNVVQSQIREVLNKEYTDPKYQKLFHLNELIYDNVCREISKTVSENIKIQVGLNKDNLDLYDLNKDNLF